MLALGEKYLLRIVKFVEGFWTYIGNCSLAGKAEAWNRLVDVWYQVDI